MTQIEAKSMSKDTLFRLKGYEKIEYVLAIVVGAFALKNCEPNKSYERFRRCLVVIDANISLLYKH